MKKLIMICLVLVMAFTMTATMTLSAAAELGDFVSSPSGNQAPELVGGENEKGDKVNVTSYTNRNLLSAEARQTLEAAYASIVGTTDVSTLNSRVAEIAAGLGIDVAALAVSDLFDVSPKAESTGTFTITLKAETMANFVCLLHYHNGQWEVVENAKLTDGGNLEFSVDSFSPFAVVVNTGSAQAPVEDHTVLIVGVVSATVVVAGGAALYLLKLKKKI